jgi:hypothetical protein
MREATVNDQRYEGNPEPKRGVVVLYATWDPINGYQDGQAKMLFKDVGDPWDLPQVARCEATIEEWREWCHWWADNEVDWEQEEDREAWHEHIDGLAGEALEKARAQTVPLPPQFLNIDKRIASTLKEKESNA